MSDLPDSLAGAEPDDMLADGDEPATKYVEPSANNGLEAGFGAHFPMRSTGRRATWRLFVQTGTRRA